MVKRVLSECIPTVFSLMLLSMYAVIDGLFIGNYAGDVGLAAINLAWPITALITATGVGIGIGASVMISHERGSQNKEKIAEIFQVAFTMLCIATALLMTLLLPLVEPFLVFVGAKDAVLTEACAYGTTIASGLFFQLMGSGMIPILRNFQMSTPAMFCMGFGTILNIIVNYILICVVKIGILGAAYGTIIAQAVVSIIALFLLRSRVKPKLCFAFSCMKQIIQRGFTAFGMSLAPSLSLVFTNWQCVLYGGDAAVACYSVITYIAFPIQGMISGIGDGCQPLMSYYTGANDQKKLSTVVKIARRLACGFALTLSLIVWILAPSIAGWFGLSAEGTLLFDIGMKIYAVSFIIVSMARLHICYLNATLHSKKATLLTYSESLIVSPILLATLPLLWEINGIWLSYLVTGIVLCFAIPLTMPKNKTSV